METPADPATHYTPSKGPRLAIVDMPYPYLKSAHAKAKRESAGAPPERWAEIEAMGLEIERRDRIYAEEEAAKAASSQP